MQVVLFIVLLPVALIVGGLVGFIMAARKGREAPSLVGLALT